MSKDSASDGRSFRRRTDSVAELFDGVHVLQLVRRIGSLEQESLQSHGGWNPWIGHDDFYD